MSSFAGIEPVGGQVTPEASPTEADRALVLAVAAWGNRCRRPHDTREPGDIACDFIETVRKWLAPAAFEPVRFALERDLYKAGSIDPEIALDRLRSMHQATARVDLGRVHPSWCVRALREESPAVQRVVVASLSQSLRGPLQAGLLLDSRDLVGERPAAPEVASWVMSLWSERLVGGEPERADDPPSIIMLSRLPLRGGYRLCQRAGLCKLILAGQNRDGPAHATDQPLREWLEGRLAAADEDLRIRSRHDVESPQVSRVPPRQRTAGIGLTTVARLLAAAEPFRLRWALQHWPYPIAKLIRSLMPPATNRTSALLQGETLILKTAWDRLNVEGRLALPWPESLDFKPRDT